jgi:hypothetical protein
VISPTDFFASPNKSEVLASQKSGLSMSAKPKAIERFSATTAPDWSTSRIATP